MNFTRLIRWISKRFPDNDAVVASHSTVTFRELWRNIDAAASIYRRWGVSRGDRVLLLLPNGADFLYFYVAALKIGAISVPLRPEYRCWEVECIVRECKPSLLVTHDEWLAANPEILRLCANKLLVLEQVSYETIEGDDTICLVKSDAVASINYVYSGGGYPNGAMLTHANYIYAAIGYARHHGFQSDDRLMIILPMSHVYALSGCVAALIRGAALVVVNQIKPKSIFAEIQRNRVTILSAVPVIFEYLADFSLKRRYDLSSLRRCITGGDYMPEVLQRKFANALGVEIVQGYGLTESLPIVCNPPGLANKPGTLGIPGRKDIIIRIVGPENETLPVGKLGEIAISSPTTMKGYYLRSNDTARILRKGWLYTGDLGTLDEDGYLHFHGTRKKVYNLYGNKVDPMEVREALLEHPEIQGVEVYAEASGAQDQLMGAVTICAKVLLKESQALDVDQIRAFWMAKIATYKVPKKIRIVETLGR